MSFFRAGSPYFDHPLLTEARSREDVDAICERFEVGESTAVLDVGCGFGRHANQFAGRGCSVVGVDPSAAMIDAARRAGTDATFVVGEVADLGPERFDLAVCLFTTLGQIDDHGRDNLGLLADVHRRLAPGGSLIVEVPNRAVAVAALVAHDDFGGEVSGMSVTRSYDPSLCVVSERFARRSPGGVEVFDLAYRLLDAEELTDALQAAGFVDVTLWGGLDGKPLRSEDPMLVATATVPS